MNSGYIYVLINPTLRANCYKIGKTNREPSARARELSSGTGVATHYEVAYQKFFEDVALAESRVHAALRLNRINTKREFFEVSLHDAVQVIEAIARDETPEPVEATRLSATRGTAAPAGHTAPTSKAKVASGASERACAAFWEALLEAGVAQSEVWRRFKPTNYQWITTALPGVPKAIFYIIVNKQQIHMELVFTTGEGSPNIEIFERLYERRGEVETAFGQALVWKRFPKTSKVQYIAGNGCYQERPDWPQLIEPTVQHFEPFFNALQGHTMS